MARMVRILIIFCCAAIVAQCFILYVATGSRVFTRYPTTDLAQMHEQQGSLTSLFDDGSAGPALIPNDFSFGLLPSPALSPEALSVTTIGGPALVAALLAVLPGRKPARSVQKETAS